MIKTAGYSNYWTYHAGPNNPDGGFTEQQWATLLREAKSIIQKAAKQGIVINGPDGTGKPVLNEDEISLNGSKKKRESYETFYLPRIPYDDGDGVEVGGMREVKRDSSKTDGLPYDAVVASILAEAAKISDGTFEVDSDRGTPRRTLASDHMVDRVVNQYLGITAKQGLKTSNDRVIESIGDKGAWIADDDPYPRLVWVRDLNMPKFCLNKVTNGYFLDVLYSSGGKLSSDRAENFEEWVPQLKAIASGANPKEFGLKSAPSELPGTEWERDGYFITSNGSLVMELIGSPVGKIRATFFGKYVWETQAPWAQGPLIKLGKTLTKQFYQRTLQMSRLDGDWKRTL